jgi:inhibitor of Bruton tyrosine kinase
MQHINIHNACLVLVEASYLHSWALIDHIQDYLSINLETMLESHFLDDLTPDLVKQLSKFVRQRQLEKAPITRSTKLYDVAFDKFETWLSLQDIPRPIVPSIKHGPFRDSPRISPPTPLKRTAPSSPVVQRPRAELPTNRVQTTSSGDDIFAMDEPTSSLGASPPKPGGLGGSWKIIGTSKR